MRRKLDKVGRKPSRLEQSFISPVFGDQFPCPGMKMIVQDSRFDGTIAFGVKVAIKSSVKGKNKFVV